MVFSGPRSLTPEERQAMLAAIVDSSDDVIISKTLEGIITSWNKSAEKLFEFTALEAVGNHISMIIPESRLSEEELIISRVALGKKIDHFETVRISKSGKEIPISLTVSPIVSESGRVIGASKIGRDISDRLTAEGKQAVLASIVDSSDDMIVSKTLNGIITSWNKAAEKMMGYSEAEVIGEHISIIIPPARLEEENFIISQIKSGRKIDHFETYRQTKDGREIPLSITVSPVLDSKGTIIGASKIARDITEQLKAKEEANRLYEEIAILNDKKDEFIGLASHELKTPLSTISGYLQILNRRLADEQDKNFLSKTLEQTKKLSTLVNDLLDVSVIESGKMVLRKESFNLLTVIDDAIELLNHSTLHTFTIKRDAEEIKVNADRQRIEQVIVNLLSNAMKYSPNPCGIEISITSNQKETTVGIKDCGLGINPDHVDNIFTRFYRAEENNPNISGLGIGLYLSKEIIDKHQGRIWVDTAPGVGSTFWFTIPNHTETFE
jgi:PAS domain S-box-containing protein